VAFAPKDNPRIAVAVVVENGGYGSVAAGPIAGFIMEKYLNDTISKEGLTRIEEVSKMNLIPDAIKKWYTKHSQAAATTKKPTNNKKEDNKEPIKSSLILNDDKKKRRDSSKP
jgi:penicillin-binding protein 2